MCLHSSMIPEAWCTQCNRSPIIPKRPAVHALATDVIVLDAETSERFDSMVTRENSCLIFNNTEPTRWGFPVILEDGRKTTVSPARYALRRAGRRADADDMVRCTCGHAGDKHGNGACVNPDHLITCSR